MKNEIRKIEWFRHNGMYRDDYTVFYKDGTTRTYRIKGKMNKKHFEFIQKM